MSSLRKHTSVLSLGSIAARRYLGRTSLTPTFNATHRFRWLGERVTPRRKQVSLNRFWDGTPPKCRLVALRSPCRVGIAHMTGKELAELERTRLLRERGEKLRAEVERLAVGARKASAYAAERMALVIDATKVLIASQAQAAKCA